MLGVTVLIIVLSLRKQRIEAVDTLHQSERLITNHWRTQSSNGNAGSQVANQRAETAVMIELKEIKSRKTVESENEWEKKSAEEKEKKEKRKERERTEEKEREGKEEKTREEETEEEGEEVRCEDVAKGERDELIEKAEREAREEKELVTVIIANADVNTSAVF